MTRGQGSGGWRYLDPWLFVPVLLLLGLGLIMVYSASAIMATQDYHDSYYFLKRQGIAATLGLIGLYCVHRVDYRLLWKIVYPLLSVTAILLIAVLIPGVGTSAGGAQRWLRFGGLSVQPSEFAKFGLVIFLAYALAKKQEKVKDLKFGYLPLVGVSGLIMVLVIAGRDLGTVITLSLVTGVMLYVAGTRMLYLLATGALALPFLYLALFSVPFRRQRLLTFLDPWQDQLDSGFQIIQSFIAFYNGGLTGVGLGQGRQKLFYLPAAHTDFIFSVIGEELGWIGVAGAITLFLVLIGRGFWIFFQEKEPFALFLSLGVSLILLVQVSINLGVVMGLLPTKGLTLPLVSYGGTSLMVSLLEIGILMNISSHQRSSGMRRS